MCLYVYTLVHIHGLELNVLVCVCVCVGILDVIFLVMGVSRASIETIWFEK